VQLSRSDPRHVDTFWPLALTLDLRYRAPSWQRPAGAGPFEQPYRLTELVLFYYYLYSQDRVQAVHQVRVPSRRRYPSLGTCLVRLQEHLSAEPRALLVETLQQLVRAERRPALTDAQGMLRRR
jgi:hypothetical protein